MASGLSTSQIITVLLPACLHGDHLGSASLTTNAAGQKVSEQPFGKLRAGCYKPGACPERQREGEVRWASGAGMPTDPSTDRITGPLRAGFTFTGQRASSYGTIFMSAREYWPSCARIVTAPAPKKHPPASARPGRSTRRPAH